MDRYLYRNFRPRLGLARCPPRRPKWSRRRMRCVSLVRSLCRWQSHCSRAPLILMSSFDFGLGVGLGLGLEFGFGCRRRPWPRPRLRSRIRLRPRPRIRHRSRPRPRPRTSASARGAKFKKQKKSLTKSGIRKIKKKLKGKTSFTEPKFFRKSKIQLRIKAWGQKN